MEFGGSCRHRVQKIIILKRVGAITRSFALASGAVRIHISFTATATRSLLSTVVIAF